MSMPIKDDIELYTRVGLLLGLFEPLFSRYLPTREGLQRALGIVSVQTLIVCDLQKILPLRPPFGSVPFNEACVLSLLFEPRNLSTRLTTFTVGPDRSLKVMYFFNATRRQRMTKPCLFVL